MEPRPPAPGAVSPYLQPALATGGLTSGHAPAALGRDDAGARSQTRRRQRRGLSLIPTYFRYPPLKPAHWRWLVITYFFVGGIAGFSQALAMLLHLTGDQHDRAVVRAGRYLSLGGMAIAPLLLTLDLKTPQRFHHMLRIFKSRSAMSLGSWAISLFGAATGALAARQLHDDGLLDRWRPLRSLASVVPETPTSIAAGSLGLVVASYTGVLLSATNIAVWARQAPLIGPLVLSSAASTATAALRLVLLGHASATTHERLERFDIVAALAELALLASAVTKGGRHSRTLVTGIAGGMLAGGAASGILIPLAIGVRSRLRGQASASGTIIASVLALLGGFLICAAYVFAGHASAESPEDYFTYATRKR